MGRQHPVEVLGAVHVAGIAHVIVVAAVAGRGEGIVPAHRVLNDLDQRFELAVEGLRRQAWCRVAAAQQGARHGGVEREVETLVDLAGGQRLEIRALTTRDVDHLDPLTGPHQIGIGGGRPDADVVDRVGERLGQDVEALAGGRCRTGDSQLDGGGRVLFFGRHVRPGHCNNKQPVARDRQLGAVAGAAAGAKQSDRTRLRKIDAAPAQGTNRARRAHAIA